MATPDRSTRVARCTCPFCGNSRRHDPPDCECSVCWDGDRKPLDHRVVVKVAQIPPPCKDVAELLMSPGGDAKYEAMIRYARPGPSWMIDHLDDAEARRSEARDLTTPEGKVEACQDMIDILLHQPPILRGHYVRKLAERLEVPEREIRQTLNQVLRERADHYQQHPEDVPTLPNPDLMAQRVFEV